MEKMRKEIRYDLDPVVLYIDDIEEIIRIGERELQSPERSLPSRIRILLGHYELTSIEEVSQVPGSTAGEFSVSFWSGGSRRLAISVGTFDWVSLQDDDIVARGVSDAIKELLFHRRHLPWLKNTVRIMCIMLPLLVGGMLYRVGYSSPGGWFATAFFCSIANVVMLFGSAILRSSKIILSRRSERKSFIQSNRNQLILNIISAILGAATIVVAQYFLSLFGLRK